MGPTRPRVHDTPLLGFVVDGAVSVALVASAAVRPTGRRLLACAAVLAVLAAGCGDDDDTAAAVETWTFVGTPFPATLTAADSESVTVTINGSEVGLTVTVEEPSADGPVTYDATVGAAATLTDADLLQVEGALRSDASDDLEPIECDYVLRAPVSEVGEIMTVIGPETLDLDAPECGLQVVTEPDGDAIVIGSTDVGGS